MELKEFILLAAQKKLTIFFFLIIFLTLTVILSLIQSFKYGASSQVLMIQNFSNPNPYLTSKSTEYLSNILAKVIYSNSFFTNALNSGYFIDKNYFGPTVKAQMKNWKKTISAKAVNDSGIISLNVYHTDRSQAELITRAVIYTLQTKHGLYHGGADNVSIKIIDEPIISAYPVKPNLILNFSLALILGLIFSLVYIYLFPEEKYDIRLAPKAAVRATRDDLCEEPELAPPILQNVVQPVEPLAEPEYNFNENLNKINNESFNNYDDLDLHEEISGHGSMNNILGKPSPDNL